MLLGEPTTTAPPWPVHSTSWVPTLPVLLKDAAQRRPAVRFSFRGAGGIAGFTLSEIFGHALRVAAGLTALGVGRGVVAVQLPHRVEAVVTQCAALHAGAVVLPLSSSAGPAAVRSALEEARATAFVTTAWHAHEVLRSPGAVRGPRPVGQVIAVSGTWPAAAIPADAVDWAMLEAFRPTAAPSGATPDDCLLLSVPGTGSRPPHLVRRTPRALLPDLLAFDRQQAARRGRTHLCLVPPDHGWPGPRCSDRLHRALGRQGGLRSRPAAAPPVGRAAAVAADGHPRCHRPGCRPGADAGGLPTGRPRAGADAERTRR
ncbi:AMP-binding protein [Streptomyces sp. NPDC088747]|uniref:AMP-binding protein n=1 Tax=Streptomyces sp. NPDC088747 TaxID=3365886 RepID=UPI00380F8EE5